MSLYVRCTTCGRELGSNDPRTDDQARDGESIGDVLARLTKDGHKISGPAGNPSKITCNRCRVAENGSLPRPANSVFRES